jgi:LPS-assembly protein
MLRKPSVPSCRSGSSLRPALMPSLLCLFFVFPTVSLAQQAPCSVPSDPENVQTTLTLRADQYELVKNIFYGRGHVVMTYKDMRVTADRVTYDRSTGDVEARGHVTFDDSRGHLEAEYAHYNVYNERGWFSKVHGYVRFPQTGKPLPGQLPATPTQLFVQAERIDRLDKDTFTIQDAEASSCQKESRGLAFDMERAKLEIGHSLTGHEAVFRFLGLPIFYLPFVEVSASRAARQTGFLLPEIGENTQKGFEIGDGFFWAMNPSADLMLGLEDYSLRGLGVSGRFRALPSDSSSIAATFFAINDHASGRLRSIRTPGGSFQITGDSDDLGDGFRGVVNVNYVNTLAFRETWAENFSTAVLSEAQQSGFATKNFDAYSFNLYASRYQDFLSAAPTHEQSVIIRQFPSVSFSGVDNQIGESPFYFAFDTSADGVGRSAPNLVTPTLSERLDLFPRLTVRLRPIWNFHVTPTFAVRETFYGTSLKPDHSPVNRSLGEFSVDLQPPSFEKTFARPLWGRRFEHVIEPDIQYHLVKATDPQNIFDIVPFTATDFLTEDNELEYSLTNSLLERKIGGKSKQARDLISWTISQKYFFDPSFGGTISPGSQVPIEPALSLTGFSFPLGRRFSPIDSDLTFSLSSNFDTELRTDIDPQGGGVLDAGISSGVHSHSLDLAMTDFFVNRTELLPAPIAPAIPFTLVPTFNLLDVVASYSNLLHKRLSEGLRLDYNFSQGIAEDVVAQVSYNFGCFALNAQYERYNLGAIRNENLFRVSISLGNIGTFGSLKPGQFLQRQLQQALP